MYAQYLHIGKNDLDVLLVFEQKTYVSIFCRFRKMQHYGRDQEQTRYTIKSKLC